MNQTLKFYRTRQMLFMLSAFVLATASSALAGGAAALPWDTALGTIAASLTGPTAWAIALLAGGFSFGTLMFGGELNQFARTSSVVGLGGAGLVATATLLSGIFGIAGAIV